MCGARVGLIGLFENVHILSIRGESLSPNLVYTDTNIYLRNNLTKPGQGIPIIAICLYINMYCSAVRRTHKFTLRSTWMLLLLLRTTNFNETFCLRFHTLNNTHTHTHRMLKTEAPYHAKIKWNTARGKRVRIDNIIRLASCRSHISN